MTGHRCCICEKLKQAIQVCPSIEFPRRQTSEHYGWRCFLFERKISSQVFVFVPDSFPMKMPVNMPNVTLGKRFASPINQGPRAKRAKEQRMLKEHSMTPASAFSSRLVTPAAGTSVKVHTVTIGEQLQIDYSF